jgi:hypothetical protein
MKWTDASSRFPGRAEGFVLWEASDGEYQVEQFPDGKVRHIVTITGRSPSVGVAQLLCERLEGIRSAPSEGEAP